MAPAPSALIPVADAGTADGDVRILRRLRLAEGPTGWGDPGAGSVGAALDVETTGFDARADAVIELAVRRFRYDEAGVITRIGRLYSWREDPGRPIPEPIARLTGLTDAEVAGRRIDDALVARLLGDVDMVVAHNADFDFKFVAARFPDLCPLLWGCSMAEIDWPANGYDGRKLGHLLYQCGLFHDAHSAGADVDAVIALLGQEMADGRTALAHLAESSADEAWRVRAVAAPIALKDHLRRRGYRWDADDRVWHRRVAGRICDAERAWLAETIYADRVNPFGNEPAWDRLDRRHRYA